MRLLIPLALCLLACAEPAASHVRHVDAAEAAPLARTVTVLDVRTPAEHEAGAIPGSVNADWNGDFRAGLAELDRDAPLLVTCESGGRSTKALAVLAEEGFTEVIHLDGGMRAWREAGLPTE